MLISYEDKSKTGTYKLGIVKEVEIDTDGLVRTCVVGYRLVRSDMPVEELRFYYKGLKCKELRVPVQRLCIILPVEEYDEPEFLRKSDKEPEKSTSEEENKLSEEETVGEVGNTLEKRSGTERETVEEKCKEEMLEEYDEIKLNDAKQVSARNCLIRSYRESKEKKRKVRITDKSAKSLHGDSSVFEITWQDCQGGVENL